MFEFPAQGARPVWIASYPRSGNTFLRLILQNYFHLPSFSVYYVEGDDHGDPSADALEQAPLLPRDWRARLSNSSQLSPIPIKTHGPPTDTAPAIYIARDGRAAIHSYYYYHKKFAFEQPSLTEVIAGACQFGSWSEHYRAWQPKTRPNTLLLSYDELVTQPEKVIPRLANFLQLPAAQASVPPFQQLQQRSPEFFRRGQNKDYLQEWSPAQMALFNQLHASVMKELGFELAPVSTPPVEAVTELAQSAARLHRMYLEQLSNVGQALRNHRQEAAELSRQVRLLSDWIQQVHRPMANNRWVRFGVAVGAVPPVTEPNVSAAPGSDAAQPAPGVVKPSGGNTQSFSPSPPPAAPSVPSQGASARG